MSEVETPIQKRKKNKTKQQQKKNKLQIQQKKRTFFFLFGFFNFFQKLLKESRFLQDIPKQNDRSPLNSKHKTSFEPTNVFLDTVGVRLIIWVTLITKNVYNMLSEYNP